MAKQLFLHVPSELWPEYFPPPPPPQELSSISGYVNRFFSEEAMTWYAKEIFTAETHYVLYFLNRNSFYSVGNYMSIA